MGLADALIPELDHEAGNTRRILERLPESKLSWKPHEKSMSLGVLASHIAEVPHWTGAILGSDSDDIAPVGGPPYKPPSEKTVKEILTRLQNNIETARGLIQGLPEGQWMKPWSLLKGGQLIFTLPKAAVIRAMIFSHMIHHRGQLTVYLRLNNVPLPQIYGPTADEGM